MIDRGHPSYSAYSIQRYLTGGVPYIFGVTGFNSGALPSTLGLSSHWYSPSPSSALPEAHGPSLL